MLYPGMPIALPNYALCSILPLTLPHSRLNEVANLEQLESKCGIGSFLGEFLLKLPTDAAACQIQRFPKSSILTRSETA